MENLDKIAIAERMITKEFTFLEEEGYERKCEIVNDETFIECLSVRYLNTEKKRKISIDYTEGMVYDDIKYTFGASISRVPYLDVEDSFALFIYLNSIGQDFSTSMTSQFDEREAKGIVKKLAGALKYYAGDIISGKEWLDDYWARW
jgi:hypothetical protein